MWGTMIAGWVLIIGMIVAGLSGYFQWAWWVPVMGGVIAAVVREASQGFRLTQDAGAGFLVRSIIMTLLMFGVIWTIGYGLSRVF